MPPRRQLASSDGTIDGGRALTQIQKDVKAMQQGRHRGPGSSFGSPFLITNRDSSVTWALDIDATGSLVAYVLDDGTGNPGPPTVMAPFPT